MDSKRFLRPIVITHHARERMTERGVDETLLADVIDYGEVRFKDTHRLWIARHVSKREDNLICAAIALEDTVVVKTVMHHVRWEA